MVETHSRVMVSSETPILFQLCTIGSTVSYGGQKSFCDGSDYAAPPDHSRSVARIEQASADAERTAGRIRLLCAGALLVAGVLPWPSGEAGVRVGTVWVCGARALAAICRWLSGELLDRARIESALPDDRHYAR